MHIGETLLGHIKNCRKCQLRYSFVMQNKTASINSMIRQADKRFKCEVV